MDEATVLAGMRMRASALCVFCGCDPERPATEGGEPCPCECHEPGERPVQMSTVLWVARRATGDISAVPQWSAPWEGFKGR